MPLPLRPRTLRGYEASAPPHPCTRRTGERPFPRWTFRARTGIHSRRGPPPRPRFASPAWTCPRQIRHRSGGFAYGVARHVTTGRIDPLRWASPAPLLRVARAGPARDVAPVRPTPPAPPRRPPGRAWHGASPLLPARPFRYAPASPPTPR